MRFRILIICFLVSFATLMDMANNPIETRQVKSTFTGINESAGNFRKADKVIPFSFPLDHGPHNEYQTEWWYYTGNLQTADGRPFGYQLTFFRRALSGQPENRTSTWATNEVYMAHFALTDPTGQKYSFQEKLERGIPDLAGAQGEPTFGVWLHNWEVRQTGANAYHLKANQTGNAIELDLTDIKGPILQGDKGYSRKGSEPGNASYYYSLARMTSTGSIRIGENSYPVSGLSWMDHEYSTSALGVGVIGWDWFSIQLDNDTEIMLFILRKEDGSHDRYSSGTLIDKNGITRQLAPTDFVIKPHNIWISPSSGAKYPSGWLVTIPSEDLQLNIIPVMKDQEFSGFFTYWEGSVKINGIKKGNPVSGSGYAELTGYAASMQGQF
jgi:predicted secreted hydrolase